MFKLFNLWPFEKFEKKVEFTFWLFSEKELSDLHPIFENMFPTLSLYSDCEDTWEWLIGKTKTEDLFINISRKHNWKHGLYDEEVIIIIDTYNNEDVDFYEKMLKEKFETTIFICKKTKIKWGEYEFELKGKLKK